MTDATTAPAADPRPKPVGDPVTAILLGAMPEEVEPLLRLADRAEAPRRVGGAELTACAFGARRALVVRSGIGLASAASAATIALLRAGPVPVLSIGTAGGIGAQVRVGQIAIGDEYRYSKADARAFGYELGQVPQQPAAYLADDRLRSAACAEADALGLAASHGLVLSSDVFVTPEESAAALAAFPGAMSVDMESTAIAQVCHGFGAPFCSIRAISDLCGPDAGGDFDRHLEGAADLSARLAAVLPARLP